MAVTWSGLLWAAAPQPWPARERAALTSGYLRAAAEWVVLQPPARWSHLMRAGEREWPVGLPHPFADAGTKLRYTMGDSACSVAGPHPELVGRAVPVSVLGPANRGPCPDVVLNVGVLPSLRGAVPEEVLAPPATSQGLFPGCTIQPLGEGPLLVFVAGAAPPGLLAALGAFFPWRKRPCKTSRRRSTSPSSGRATSSWASNSTPTRTTSISSANRRPPPTPTPLPQPPRPPRGPRPGTAVGPPA